MKTVCNVVFNEKAAARWLYLTSRIEILVSSVSQSDASSSHLCNNLPQTFLSQPQNHAWGAR
jgi:hypothetical protein